MSGRPRGALLCGLMVTVSACASQIWGTKVYDGPRLPPHKVALVSAASSGVKIDTINGRNVYSAIGTCDPGCEVLPGRVTVSAHYWDSTTINRPTTYSSGTAQVTSATQRAVEFDAEPGVCYAVADVGGEGKFTLKVRTFECSTRRKTAIEDGRAKDVK
jgi:hypothetical protein